SSTSRPVDQRPAIRSTAGSPQDKGPHTSPTCRHGMRLLDLRVAGGGWFIAAVLADGGGLVAKERAGAGGVEDLRVCRDNIALRRTDQSEGVPRLSPLGEIAGNEIGRTG